MAANTTDTENDLVDRSVAWLRDHLPPTWKVEVRWSDGGPVIDIQGLNSYATLALEAKTAFGPRDVERLLGSAGRKLRALAPSLGILVVAPWLSPRTRELLTAEGFNYLDLTGNAAIRLDNPAVFLRTDGAQRNPSPPPRGRAQVRGPKAARLIRGLIDVRPPYGVRQLATATRLTAGYVSRLLDALDEDALIERSRRGAVEATDVEGLLRRWAETYDVFSTNDAATYVAPRGGNDVLRGLGDHDRPAAVTGSFAAVLDAPVARPSLLCVYVENTAPLVDACGLLPADEGANVALLRPFDPVVWSRAVVRDGVRYVARPQAAIDCLTGNGRMPAEGEALLAWMLGNETEWRMRSLEIPGRDGA